MKTRWFQALVAALCALALMVTACERSKVEAEQVTPSSAAKVVEAPATKKQGSSPEGAEAPDSEPAVHEPFLWRIEGSSGHHAHILGTIHMGFDAKKELPPVVWERLEAAEIFVMETDLTRAQADMLKSAALPEGQSLEELLGPEMWSELDERLGGAASQFKSVKPWFVVSMLIMKMLPEDRVSAPMDQVLHHHARQEGLEFAYLEAPSEQLEILEQTLTVSELKEMLREFDQQKEQLRDMLDYYRAGDAEQVEQLSFKDLDEKPQMHEKLFFARNEAWIPKIEEQLKKGDVFIAFGAGHLFGDRGVLALLEQRGLEPVRVPAEEAEPEPPAGDESP